jgi:hypothetical protein
MYVIKFKCGYPNSYAYYYHYCNPYTNSWFISNPYSNSYINCWFNAYSNPYYYPTPSPSATPSASVFYINISNTTDSADITNITVNGIAISGVTFPVVSNDGASGVSNQLGTYTVVISYSGASSDYVEIIDTDSNYDCTNAVSTSRTFNGQITNAGGGGGIMYITMGDGGCP